VTLVYHPDDDEYEASCDGHALLEDDGDCPEKQRFSKGRLKRKAAVIYLTRILHWRLFPVGKDDVLACPNCARRIERQRRDARFSRWWAQTVEPKIEAARSKRHEKERLGLK